MRKKVKHTDAHAINATIGALIDDDGKLYEFKSITNIFNQIDNNLYRAYPAIDGGQVF